MLDSRFIAIFIRTETNYEQVEMSILAHCLFNNALDVLILEAKTNHNQECSFLAKGLLKMCNKFNIRLFVGTFILVARGVNDARSLDIFFFGQFSHLIPSANQRFRVSYKVETHWG